MEESVVYEEKARKEVIHEGNPFLVVSPKDVVLIGDLEKVSQLNESGLIVLKYVTKNLNQHTGITILSVKDICLKEFRQYFIDTQVNKMDIKVKNTLETRIRRGIRNLLSLEIIAISKGKNQYWVNKSVIWR
jgi:hypothetical protein